MNEREKMEKVLLIDDEQKTREALAKVIQKEGFEAFTTQDGEEGLKVFYKEKPAIVITDIKMPRMSGLELLNKVQEFSPETHVILISAHGDYDTVVTALNYGATDYLKKPIDIHELIVILGRCQEKINERRNIEPRYNILIMEDEEVARKNLVKVLKSQDRWNVLSVCDGEEGLNLLSKQKIDIMILDLQMPRKDGLSVLREIRKTDMDGDCEVIIMTGYGDEATATEALRLGAIGFQQKPIDIEHLIFSVDKAIEKLKTRRSLRYRTREARQAEAFIAKVTSNKEFEIDLRDNTQRIAKEFFLAFSSALDLCLCVVDREMNLVLVNDRMNNVMKEQQTKLDEGFVEKLKAIGVLGTSSSTFQEAITGILEDEQNSFKTISTGKYSYVFLSRIVLLTNQEIKKGALFVVRGERSITSNQ